MPRGGHNAKSTAELKAAGTYRKDRHAARLEVPAVSEIPPPPPGFDKEHAKKWNEVCALLNDMGVLTSADVDAVRRYVEASIMANRAYATLEKEGFVLDGRKHPANLVYFDVVKTMRALFDQFGFTPRARMTLKIEKKKDSTQDPFLEIMEAMQGKKS